MKINKRLRLKVARKRLSELCDAEMVLWNEEFTSMFPSSFYEQRIADLRNKQIYWKTVLEELIHGMA